jgi:hypothetical protein
VAGPIERTFDHLVVAARTLDEGVRWIARELGAAPVAGGEHPLMGTHNALVSLGPAAFLEVIAIDPAAAPPARPRWFELGTPPMEALLARGPALVHWVERVDDIEAALRDYPQRVDVLDVSRRQYRWRIGVPPDGMLPCGGTCPTLIQWLGPHPAASLPASGCTLVALRRADCAVLHTPRGERMLPWVIPE